MPEQRHIEEGAKEIAKLLDQKQTEEVENRLLSDMLNLQPGDFKKLLETIYKNESKNVGCDLELTYANKQMHIAVTTAQTDKRETMANGYDDGNGQWRFNKPAVYDRIFGEGKNSEHSSVIEQNPHHLLNYLTSKALAETTAEFTHAELLSPEGRKRFEEQLKRRLPAGISLNSTEIKRNK